MTITYLNLTQHAIDLYDADGQCMTIPPTGFEARIDERTEVVAGPDRTVRHVVRLGDITGIPEPAPGFAYIVSMPTAMALAASGVYRHDVLYPHQLVRDITGRIVGAAALARLEPTP